MSDRYISDLWGFHYLVVGLLLFGRGKMEAVVPPLPSRSEGTLDKLGPEGAETIGDEDRGVVWVGMGCQEQVLHLAAKRCFVRTWLSLLKSKCISSNVMSELDLCH